MVKYFFISMLSFKVMKVYFSNMLMSMTSTQSSFNIQILTGSHKQYLKSIIMILAISTIFIVNLVSGNGE